MQELKFKPENIDLTLLEQCGYKYNFLRGEKSYNGVGIFSKIALQDSFQQDFGGNNQARHIAVNFKYNNKTFELHNFYVPAGGDEPDVVANPKYAHKLKFVEDMAEYFANKPKDKNIIIVGDLNIAPLEQDVWSHKQLLKVISHTEAEVSRFNKFLESYDFVDCPRLFVDNSEKLYSWWSYRNRDWKKSNRGRRLDHIICSPSLKNSVTGYDINSSVRDWQKPSDHVPVTVYFN